MKSQETNGIICELDLFIIIGLKMRRSLVNLSGLVKSVTEMVIGCKNHKKCHICSIRLKCFFCKICQKRDSVYAWLLLPWFKSWSGYIMLSYLSNIPCRYSNPGPPPRSRSGVSNLLAKFAKVLMKNFDWAAFDQKFLWCFMTWTWFVCVKV